MKDSVVYALKLFAICAVASIILALTNQATAPVIAERKKQDTLNAYKAVYPEAEELKPLEDDSLLNDNIIDIQEAVVGGETVGYIFNVNSPSGYDGPVNYVVGVDKDGTVLGFQVIAQTETSGFGAQVAEPEYAERVVDGTVISGEITADEQPGEGVIPAISGATKTTNAMIGGFNAVSESLSALQ